MHRILKKIPLFLASGVVLFPLALWFLSSCLGHINPVWPYVSDLGVVPPEASLFSVFMCGGAAFLCMFALIRYDINQSFVGRSVFVKVEEAPSDAIMKDPAKERQFLHYINLSFASGLMMALGFLLIGCFRHNEIPIVQFAHNVFAAVGFLSVLVDIYLEMRISVLLGNEQVARYRRIIFALCILFLVVYNTSGVASFVTNPKMFEKKEPRLMWSESDTGYFLHLISTFVEWLLIYQLTHYAVCRKVNVPSTGFGLPCRTFKSG